MRLIKKFLIVLIIVCMLYSFAEVFATSIYDSAGITGEITNAGNASATVTNITSTVLTVIRYTGSGIALIMLTLIFIKYMLSAASERAELKKNLIPFTIGAIVLFAASNLVTILQSVANKMFATTTSGGD